MGAPNPTLQRHLTDVEERLRTLEARIHALEAPHEDRGGAAAVPADYEYAVEGGEA